jgi:hypothetical protein
VIVSATQQPLQVATLAVEVARIVEVDRLAEGDGLDEVDVW